MIQHLAQCTDCREIVADVARIVTPRTRRSSLPLWGTAAAVLVAGVAGLLWWRADRDRAPHAVLASLVGERRLIHARLSGPFHHEAWEGAPRGADAMPAATEEALRLRLASLRADLEKRDRPATRADIGATLLLLGEADGAIDALEAACASEPDNAAWAADLSAAYLERKDAEAPIAALDWAAHALRLDPQNAPAAFNRALARARLFAAGEPNADPRPVVEAWQRYLEIDAASPWADEARRAIEALQGAVPPPPVTPAIDSPQAKRGLTAFREASAEIAEKRLDAGLRIADAALAALPADCCPEVAGVLSWTVGYVQALKGRYASAIDAYQRSLARFGEAGDAPRAAEVLARLAELYALSNEGAKAWEFRSRAFETFGGIEPREKHAMLTAASYACEWAERPYAALDLLDVALEYADAPGPRAETYALQARAAHAVGLDDEAVRHAAAAMETAAAVDDDRTGPRYRAEAALAYAAVAAATEPETTAEYLSRAIEHFERAEQPARLAELYAERWNVERALGRTRSSGDFERALRLVRESRGDYPTLTARMRFFARAGRLVERELNRLAGEEHERAFGLVEQLRFDSLGCGRPDVLPSTTYADVLARLRDGDRLLYYAFAGDRWLAWLFRAGEAAPARFVVPASELERVILHGPRDPADLRRLFGLLIGGERIHWAGARRLLVVSDGRLAAVPFALLVDGEAGRAVIERVPVVHMPAATPLGEREVQPEIGRVALLGAWNAPGSYPALPAVRESLSALERVWGERASVHNDAATRRDFEDAFARSDLLHFSGHAVFDERHPDRSGLILADPERPKLSIEDLDRQDRAAPRIVILAACRSAGLTDFSTAGSVGFTPILLARGAEYVVTIPRPVNDRVAAEFTQRLHRRLADGETIERAFQSAQEDFASQSGPAHAVSWVLYTTRL